MPTRLEDPMTDERTLGTAASDLAIRVRGLRKSFGDVRALDGVDLDVPHGTVLGLLGPNGAGKTTAVRVMATLLEPDAGTACVAGLDAVEEATQLREKIGLAGQYAASTRTSPASRTSSWSAASTACRARGRPSVAASCSRASS